MRRRKRSSTASTSTALAATTSALRSLWRTRPISPNTSPRLRSLIRWRSRSPAHTSVAPEPHAEEVPEGDDLRGREEGGQEDQVRPERGHHGEAGEDAEVLDRDEAREGKG